MNANNADLFYLKALTEYPWELGAVMEYLSYALSYDEEHGPANCLMGQVYMYYIKDYKHAELYFERAIAGKIEYLETYKCLSLLKIWRGEYEAAHQIIDFAIKLKGMDKSVMYGRRAMIYECQADFSRAEQQLYQAVGSCFDPEERSVLTGELERVQKRIKQFEKCRG